MENRLFVFYFKRLQNIPKISKKFLWILQNFHKTDHNHRDSFLLLETSELSSAEFQFHVRHHFCLHWWSHYQVLYFILPQQEFRAHIIKYLRPFHWLNSAGYRRWRLSFFWITNWSFFFDKKVEKNISKQKNYVRVKILSRNSAEKKHDALLIERRVTMEIDPK